MTDPLPLRRFGVTLSWQSATVEGVRVVASEADNLGYGHIWLQEGWGLEGLSTAGYLLGLTKRIRVATGVLNVYSRSAALIAMGCVTLNQISPGRFILGLGCSGRGLIEDWHGAKFEKPLTRTMEYLDVVKRVVRGEPIDYEGETVDVKRFRLFTHPIQDKLEICIGAMGKRNLKLAGKMADGAILVMYPMSALDVALKLLNGKRLFVYYRVRVTGSKEEEEKARFQIAKNIAFYISSMGRYYIKNLSRLGYTEDVQRIAREVATSGTKGGAEVVSDELFEELALVGSAKSILQKINERIPDGAYPIFDFSIGSTEEIAEAVRSLRSIASEIAK